MSTLTAHTIRIKVSSVDDIFDAFNPSPLGERVLSPKFLEYVLHQARLVGDTGPINISIHGLSSAESSIPELVQAKLRYAHADVTEDLSIHFRDSRKVFLIAVGVMLVSVLLFELTARIPLPGPIAAVHESIVVFGWVAMWRPAEMLFFDWIPLHKRKKLLERMKQGNVTLAQ